MKANEVNLNRFLSQNDTQFVIPVYQRNYDWTQAQCKQLLDDIFLVGKNDDLGSHFIGSIVYIHDDLYSSAGIRELSIIDGQQRLTTVTLIYITLYTIAKESGNEQLVSRIQKTYLINEFAKEEEKLKLKPTENNDNALKFLLNQNLNDEFTGYSRLIENYNYFKSRMTQENIDIVQKGLGKLMFVEISLERGKDDPQKIFESLNSTGLELSQSDLIRNYILMGLKPKDQNRIYEKYWKQIELNAQHEETRTNKVSDFIRDFLTFKNREIPNKSKVYQEYKKKYPVSTIESLEHVLQEIKKYSQHYKKLLNPDYEQNREIQTQLRYINKLEINVAYPFLMEVYEDYSNQKISASVFVEIMEVVQSFTWRRFVMSLPTNALNKIFMRLYEDLSATDYVLSMQKSLLNRKSYQRFPRDKEVLETLGTRDMYGIQSKNRTYFLERLENFENREPVTFESNTDITIEHIFPQTPDSKWKTDIGEEEFKEIQEKYLNTIANLTLSGNNGKLSNKCFVEKREMNVDGKEQGYKFSRLWLNKSLGELKKWDVEEIKLRYKLIADRFLKIWKMPTDDALLNTESNEINIFDAEDPTHKKLEYAIYFDQQLEVRTISDFYSYVMKDLFEKSPELFFEDLIKSKIQVSKNSTDFRNPLSLNETYFIEINLSSKFKLDRVKHVLKSLGYLDDVFIKYSSEEEI